MAVQDTCTICSQRVSEWMSEWVSEWVSEKERDGECW